MTYIISWPDFEYISPTVPLEVTDDIRGTAEEFHWTSTYSGPEDPFFKVKVIAELEGV